MTHRNSVQADPLRRYNVYINDGSLPFGGTFKPIHNTHNDGYILDMRPLGNTGSTSQHYDFASGAKRIADLAVVWAESAYRYETCKSKAEAQKIACEATAAATFKANFDADPNQEDYFDDIKGRLVQWINLNQQLGEIALPNGVSSISFLFSDGIQKYSGLCNTMKAMYTAGARTAPDSLVCTRNADGTTASTDDPTNLHRQFQMQILRGDLPNLEQLTGTNTVEHFYRVRLNPLKPSESGHYDHFHLKVQQ